MSTSSSSRIPDFLDSAQSTSIQSNFNFTPSIAEDTLTYTIHLPPATPGEDSESQAQSYITLLNAYVEELLARGVRREAGGRWLWHKDGWELELVPEVDIQDRRCVNGVAGTKTGLNQNSEDSESEDELDDEEDLSITNPSKSSLPARKLQGHIRIGDSVDDEWLIVYLLKQISIKYPSFIISIRDTDGEFILIEAANALPRWVSPENVDNRFWLAGGKFWLLPLEVVSREKSGKGIQNRRIQKAFDKDEDVNMEDNSLAGASYLSESDAISILRSSAPSSTLSSTQTPSQYWAGASIETVIQDRISSYPSSMSTHHQVSLAYLPSSIARTLSTNPGLIQRAVEGFYTRDPVQVRNASRATHFSPKLEDTVLVPVIMTRTSYAQLSGQQFQPPRVFGAEWRVPPPSSSATELERNTLLTEKRRRDLGVKITIGFEIMYKEDPKRSRGGKGKGLENEVDVNDEGYKRYLDGLKRAGFFAEEMEGSRGWTERLEKAKTGWAAIRSKDSSERIPFAEAVDSALISSQDIALTSLAPSPNFQEDTEDWLIVSPDELDGLLARASGPQSTSLDKVLNDESMGVGDGEVDEQAKVLSDLAAKVNEFVDGQGGLEGAQFKDELSDDDFSISDSDDESDGMDQDPPTEEQKAKRLAELIPSLPAEEWGQKTGATADSSSKAGKRVKFVDEPLVKLTGSGSDAAPTMRPPVFERDKFDGVEDDSDDESEEEAFGWMSDKRKTNTHSRRKKANDIDPNTILLANSLKAGTKMPTDTLKPMTGDELVDLSEDEDEDEDEPVEDPEVDMAGEQEEFLKFARETLGISESMWTNVMDERKSRGVFVPEPLASAASTPEPSLAPKAKAQSKSKAPDYTSAGPEPVETSKVGTHFFASVSPATPFAPTRSSQTETAQLPLDQRNPNLDSFEKVMEAMELELARARAAKDGTGSPAAPASTAKKAKGKGKIQKKADAASIPTEEDLDSLSASELEAMDRELKAALKSSGRDDSDLDDSDLDDDELKQALKGLGGKEKEEFKMMKDFLESYKSQAGGSGAIGNLFGRLAQGRDTGEV